MSNRPQAANAGLDPAANLRQLLLRSGHLVPELLDLKTQFSETWDWQSKGRSAHFRSERRKLKGLARALARVLKQVKALSKSTRTRVGWDLSLELPHSGVVTLGSELERWQQRTSTLRSICARGLDRKLGRRRDEPGRWLDEHVVSLLGDADADLLRGRRGSSATVIAVAGEMRRICGLPQLGSAASPWWGSLKTAVANRKTSHS